MNDSLPNQKKLIPISEAAKVLGVSIDTVRRWDKSGVLHSERPDGKNRYFSLNELEKHKLSQPLPISEVARKLGISATTLRRLEARGLIKPKRNNAGERVYDEDLLKNFLNSGYFLKKEQIHELNDSTTLENEAEHPKSREPAIHLINLKPRPRVLRINEFMTVSTITFALLITLGIRNIWAAEFKAQSLPTSSEVLSAVKEDTAPADVVKSEILPAAESEATAAAKPKSLVKVKAEDSSSTVNIRQKPTTKSTKIGQAKDGESFEFLSYDSDWFEVKLDTGSTPTESGSTGFISAKYVMKENYE